MALRALYIWHREGKHGLPDRESLPRKVGTRKKESTLHDVINELGARLGIPLLEQSPSPRGFWRLTELGAQLAAGAQKILAVLDDRLNTVKALGALDISRLQALEQELNVTLLEKAPLYEDEPGASDWQVTIRGALLAKGVGEFLAALDEQLYDLYEVRRRDPKLVPHIHIGCFNAQVKLYLAEALGPLAVDKNFGYRIRFNRDMNIRTVNNRVILDDVGQDHQKGIKGQDPGLHRYRGFHYGVVPWISGPDAYKPFEADAKLYREFTNVQLYGWNLLVVAPKNTSLARGRQERPVKITDVLEACEKEYLPLLLSPTYNISRQMVDAAFTQSNRVPLISFVIENPDTYTRAALARHGHGIAIVTADALPPPEQDQCFYPHVVGSDDVPLRGFHTLTWKAKAAKAAKAAGFDDDGDDVDAEDDKPAGPPSGIKPAAHRRLCDAISKEVAEFVKNRQGVELLPWTEIPPSLPSR